MTVQGTHLPGAQNSDEECGPTSDGQALEGLDQVCWHGDFDLLSQAVLSDLPVKITGHGDVGHMRRILELLLPVLPLQAAR